MTGLNPQTLRLLGHFWLEEVQPADAAGLAALPDLAAALPNTGPAALTGVAVEYQRLFGFNLPPYESIFIDPSALLMAPATHRVQLLYRQAGWTPPANVRSGAPDHLGLELLALAAWLENGQTGLARQLQTRHLAWWVPAFMLALQRLAPPPFYAALGRLTLDQLLATLPPAFNSIAAGPFPNLPPLDRAGGAARPGQNPATAAGLRDLVNWLLTPCQAGLFLTRDDIGLLSRRLELPPVMGERRRMLETLFRLAGQYDLAPHLLEQLGHILAESAAAYQTWSHQYPLWTPYARAWQQRLAASQNILDQLNTIIVNQDWEQTNEL